MMKIANALGSVLRMVIPLSPRWKPIINGTGAVVGYKTSDPISRADIDRLKAKIGCAR
jgi:hypothetical protein